jgi:two-component system sensor histidine kinase KdpD
MGRLRASIAYVVAVVGTAVLALLLLWKREELNHTIIAFAFLVPVVAASWLGGLGPGLVASVIGSALFNLGFLPPYGTFSLERGEYVVVLVGFTLIASLISVLVGRARERAQAAEDREREVRLLFELSRELALAPERPEGLGPALARAAERLGYVGAQLIPAGDPVPVGGATELPLAVGDERLGTLLLVGDRAPLAPSESRVLRLFADQLALALQADRLERTLREAEVYRRTDGLRRALLAAASHELKSPVAAITTAVTDVLDLGDEADPAYVADVLVDVRASTSRLEELITNLLDMSRIEAGVLVAAATPLDLVDLVQGAASSVARRWPAADIHVDVVPDAAFIRADPVLLERVAVNLLDNAAREVRGQSDQRIDVSATREDGDVVVRVVDQGQGLSEADAELLFTPFYRLEERDPRLGAGLGLAICKGFVAAMGGEIWVERHVGDGATIAFRLPTVP